LCEVFGKKSYECFALIEKENLECSPSGIVKKVVLFWSAEACPQDPALRGFCGFKAKNQLRTSKLVHSRLAFSDFPVSIDFWRIPHPLPPLHEEGEHGDPSEKGGEVNIR
jgi:hypothetical protein